MDANGEYFGPKLIRQDAGGHHVSGAAPHGAEDPNRIQPVWQNLEERWNVLESQRRQRGLLGRIGVVVLAEHKALMVKRAEPDREEWRITVQSVHVIACDTDLEASRQRCDTKPGS